jgi:hypothetical protein
LQNPVVKEDTFEGLLTLHGVTKPVSGKFSISDQRAVEASFSVKLIDFAVAIPTFAGVTVADNVEVNVKIGNLTAAKQ